MSALTPGTGSQGETSGSKGGSASRSPAGELVGRGPSGLASGAACTGSAARFSIRAICRVLQPISPPPRRDRMTKSFSIRYPSISRVLPEVKVTRCSAAAGLQAPSARMRAQQHPPARKEITPARCIDIVSPVKSMNSTAIKPFRQRQINVDGSFVPGPCGSTGGGLAAREDRSSGSRSESAPRADRSFSQA